jgi:hypothetical protein
VSKTRLIGERVDPARDAVKRLRIEAHDDVGEIGGRRCAGEAVAKAIDDDHRRT